MAKADTCIFFFKSCFLSYLLCPTDKVAGPTALVVGLPPITSVACHCLDQQRENLKDTDNNTGLCDNISLLVQPAGVNR